ncbi:N-acetylglucosamine kinase [Streptomyces sp. AC495_CC817]|uniref:N-acetylglucosamine kinase n=1 Tax=Streptomyces sp. AC495_CC817 TaxID=2823900 RepID=UPI001C25D8FC|nr:BadF/BadG/BcrA/BcrD ATPase family protein [Streptomyces sp. AC495_CC817]
MSTRERTEPALDEISVDLGKSRCRVQIATASGDVSLSDGAGSPGLAAIGGVDDAVAAILRLLPPSPLAPRTAMGVGAAGALAAPTASAALADRLHAETGARVAVTSDVVTAHAGALDGATGVLLIAGTGATALGIDAADSRLVDGWGPELGDLGSGSWVGRSALRAALRSESGLGARSALTSALMAETGSPVRWLAEDARTARRLASLVPLVFAHAEDGDPVAVAIVGEAVRLLAASALAASAPGSVVALHGGLTDNDYFRDQLQIALRRADLTVVPSRGNALDGARRIATDHSTLHERFVHRAG